MTILKNSFYLVFSALMLVACSSNKTVSNQGGQQFGAGATEKGAITYESLVEKMNKTNEMPAKVTGKISEVCKVKGCWMTMVSDKPGTPEMRVTFKNYAFFMPMDIIGKTVVIDGVAAVETIPVADLRHYAEDAGKSKEEIAKITEPKRELTFEAAGVLIKN